MVSKRSISRWRYVSMASTQPVCFCGSKSGDMIDLKGRARCGRGHFVRWPYKNYVAA